MARYVALLRGINLGPHRRIAMQDLRALLADLGYTDVATLLQSGNAVFTSSRRQVAKVTAEVEEAISERLGMPVRCVLRTGAELAAAVGANPFPQHEDQGAKLMVTFLSGPLDRARFAELDPERFAPDEFAATDREIYLWLPNGMSGSRIPLDFWDKQVGRLGTTRNWNTVTKLLAMV